MSKTVRHVLIADTDNPKEDDSWDCKIDLPPPGDSEAIVNLLTQACEAAGKGKAVFVYIGAPYEGRVLHTLCDGTEIRDLLFSPFGTEECIQIKKARRSPTK